MNGEETSSRTVASRKGLRGRVPPPAGRLCQRAQVALRRHVSNLSRRAELVGGCFQVPSHNEQLRGGSDGHILGQLIFPGEPSTWWKLQLQWHKVWAKTGQFLE